MTDRRATERLLEVIEDAADSLELVRERAVLVECIAELRRRGDTLVRANDLRLILEEASADRSAVEQEFSVTNGRAESEHDLESGYTAALNRLENALGGKMR